MASRPQKARTRRYPAETLTDYPDDLELHTNTPARAEPLQHSLEQAVGSIDLHVNANKTEYRYFKRESHLYSKFTYLGSNISFIEDDVNKRLAKA